MHATDAGRRLAPLPLATLLILCLLPAGCGNGGAKRLSVSVAKLDFGRVLHGDALERVVTLRNTRSRDVTVTGTTFNCACFQLHPFRKMLHPGDSRDLRITFLSGAVPPGELRGKKMDILSDDPLYPKIEVALLGEVVKSMTLRPEIVNLGALADPESRKPFVVRLRPEPGMSVEVTRWSVKPADLLEATAKEVEGGMDFEIHLVEGASGSGKLAGWLEVRAKVTGEAFTERNIDRVVRIQGEWPPQ